MRRAATQGAEPGPIATPCIVLRVAMGPGSSHSALRADRSPGMTLEGLTKNGVRPIKTSPAEIIREYGPFDGVENVAGVTFDGENVWYAAGSTINAFDPESGKQVRTLDVAGDAGTAFDGRYIYQIAEKRID